MGNMGSKEKKRERKVRRALRGGKKDWPGREEGLRRKEAKAGAGKPVPLYRSPASHRQNSCLWKRN